MLAVGRENISARPFRRNPQKVVPSRSSKLKLKPSVQEPSAHTTTTTRTTRRRKPLDWKTKREHTTAVVSQGHA